MPKVASLPVSDANSPPPKSWATAGMARPATEQTIKKIRVSEFMNGSFFNAYVYRAIPTAAAEENSISQPE
jgi:hypothetical protein